MMDPLQYIRECAPKSAKLLRWSLALQLFDLDFVYKKGSSNVVADWFPRRLCGVCNTCVRNYLLCNLVVMLIVLSVSIITCCVI